jgi:hypothetical protein
MRVQVNGISSVVANSSSRGEILGWVGSCLGLVEGQLLKEKRPIAEAIMAWMEAQNHRVLSSEMVALLMLIVNVFGSEIGYQPMGE